MKRFLGFVSLLYAGIIMYVVVTNKINNFLAPNMQIYLKIAVIPLIIIGLVMLFNNKVRYRFKTSDLVLLLPLIMLILAGNGRLTTNFANNRVLNTSTNDKTKTQEVIEESVEEISEDVIEEYDFSNPDFEVVDENYEKLSSYLTYEPAARVYEGKTVKVKGFAIKYASYIPDGYFTIGRYLISCCAADATFTGFYAQYDIDKIKSGSWYEIEGVLTKGTDNDGYDIMYIKIINIKEIDEQEQYVYPCYAYGDGTCSEVFKYDLEY